jgi:hypothetical protein
LFKGIFNGGNIMKFLRQVIFAVLAVGTLASVPASAVVIDTDHAVTKVKSTATKVKNFVNEHKVEIGLGVAVVGLLVGLGSLLAYNKFKTVPVQVGTTPTPLKRVVSVAEAIVIGAQNRITDSTAFTGVATK